MQCRFAFFGTGQIAAHALTTLCERRFVPELVVTAPDAPKGRGMKHAASLVAQVAQVHREHSLAPEQSNGSGIETMKPSKLDAESIRTLHSRGPWDVFVVVDYGSILPRELLDIPARGTINIHPSLLPRYRGPSPVRSAILAGEDTAGVTIMLLDELVDHGPIIAQRTGTLSPHETGATALEAHLAHLGAELLADVLPSWVAGDIEAHEQNHDIATYTKKIRKEDAELDLRDDPTVNLRKIRAYEGWPTAFAFFERSGKKLRVQIIAAHIDNSALVLDLVRPEGKDVMSFADFVRSGAKQL